MGPVKTESVEHARQETAREPVKVIGEREIIAQPGPRAVEDVTAKLRQVE